MCTSVSLKAILSAPPWASVSANTVMSRLCAALTASIKWSSSPVRATMSNTSPATPKARTGRETTDAASMSLVMLESKVASAVKAKAANSGRSRSKRLRKAEAKFCAKDVPMPLPQVNTLPPPVTQAITAITAISTRGAIDCAHWYFRSALSMNCCSMRCKSMVES